MLNEKQIMKLKHETNRVQLLISSGEITDHPALNGMLIDVQSALLTLHLLKEECEGYQLSFERLQKAFDALAHYERFTVQETMPQQWAIECKGEVIACGKSMVDAALSLSEGNANNSDLSSVRLVELG